MMTDLHIAKTFPYPFIILNTQQHYLPVISAIKKKKKEIAIFIYPFCILKQFVAQEKSRIEMKIARKE